MGQKLYKLAIRRPLVKERRPANTLEFKLEKQQKEVASRIMELMKKKDDLFSYFGDSI